MDVFVLSQKGERGLLSVFGDSLGSSPNYSVLHMPDHVSEILPRRPMCVGPANSSEPAESDQAKGFREV